MKVGNSFICFQGSVFYPKASIKATLVKSVQFFLIVAQLCQLLKNTALLQREVGLGLQGTSCLMFCCFQLFRESRTSWRFLNGTWNSSLMPKCIRNQELVRENWQREYKQLCQSDVLLLLFSCVTFYSFHFLPLCLFVFLVCLLVSDYQL